MTAGGESRLRRERGRGRTVFRLLRAVTLLLGVLLAAVAPLGASPKEAAGGAAGERKALTLPGGEGNKTLELTAGAGSVFGKDELLLKEYVDIHYGDLRLQADSVRYLPATKDCFAEGNVILDNGPTRITARKVEYNLDTEKGIFYDARGYAEPSFYFEAAQVQKIDQDRYIIVDASFTTCTQPVPYWSFKVSRGTIHLDNYAYLHNVSFRLSKVPAFYSPYLVWPIKAERASGLLFPEFGFSQSRGFVLSNAIYWAIRRNMDATFFLDYYALAGLGEGLEYRFVPSVHGKGEFMGAFIRDHVTDTDRYFYNLNYREDLPADMRLVTSINQVSDFNYFLDYQRDLRLATNPLVLSDLYLTRNWGSYSFNLRAEQREQIFSVTEILFPTATNPNPQYLPAEETLTNRILPRVELRGNKQRLGSSPLYFSFQTSLDSFDKQTTLFTTSYQRFDLFPTFSAPLRLAPWLDLNPSVSIRDTYYTKRLGNLITEDANHNGIPDPGEDTGLPGYPGTAGNGILDSRSQIVDQDFVRKVLLGSLDIIGPRFSRIFDTPDSSFSPMYKNTIEPRVTYLYQSNVADAADVIQFDEKDAIAGSQNAIQYSLTTRLFAKRPGVTPQPAQLSDGLVFPQHHTPPPEEGQDLSAPTEAKAPEAASLSPVEIASFSISQIYSLLGPLSRKVDYSNILGVAIPQSQSSNFSPVDAQFRFNPTLYASLDVRAEYDILYYGFRRASLSANFHGMERGFVDLTWFYNGALDPGSVTSSQIGLLGETNLMNRKLILGFQGNYDVVSQRFQDQRYKVGYNTQCCGFTLELLDRNYQGLSQQEFRLVVNLKGIGNVLDLNSGTSAIPTNLINY